MGWTETHRYYATLRAVEDELNRRGDGVIVWHPQYADVFGSVQVLRLALHTRWETMLRAQVDVPCDAEGRPSPELCELAAAHPDVPVHIYPADHGFNYDHRASYDAPSAKLAIVMPSCTPDTTRCRSRSKSSTIFALALPRATSCRTREILTATSENSVAAKNPFSAARAMTPMSRTKNIRGCPPFPNCISTHVVAVAASVACRQAVL